MTTEMIRDDVRGYVTMPDEGPVLEHLHVRMLATGAQKS